MKPRHDIVSAGASGADTFRGIVSSASYADYSLEWSAVEPGVDYSLEWPAGEPGADTFSEIVSG